jgi:hypothetical protein
LQFSKRNKQTPLLPLPEINSIYHAESAGSRDQPHPGSFLKKREEPGNEVASCEDWKFAFRRETEAVIGKLLLKSSSVFLKHLIDFNKCDLPLYFECYPIIKCTVIYEQNGLDKKD